MTIDVSVVQLALQQIAKHPSFEEHVVSAMQIADAQYEYMRTEEYKDKPNGPFDNSEKPASSRLVNKSLMQHTIMAIVAYEQGKLNICRIHFPLMMLSLRKSTYL